MHSEVSADFVAHMEDVLDLYAEPYDPERPLVCLWRDLHVQVLADTRTLWEPARQATMAPATCEPLAGWRHVAVTERRTMQEWSLAGG